MYHRDKCFVVITAIRNKLKQQKLAQTFPLYKERLVSKIPQISLLFHLALIQITPRNKSFATIAPIWNKIMQHNLAQILSINKECLLSKRNHTGLLFCLVPYEWPPGKRLNNDKHICIYTYLGCLLSKIYQLSSLFILANRQMSCRKIILRNSCHTL